MKHLFIVSEFCRDFEELYFNILAMETSKIVALSECNIPCSYKQYKLGNVDKRNVELKTLPKDYMAVAFMPATERTQIEEEVLLYPFTSLLAEFGGALGLFLGFSFMTIWDGVKGLASWIKWLK